MTNEEEKELLRTAAWLGTDNGIHVYKEVNKAMSKVLSFAEISEEKWEE